LDGHRKDKGNHGMNLFPTGDVVVLFPSSPELKSGKTIFVFHCDPLGEQYQGLKGGKDRLN
jgi:hypothetical protein